MANANLLKLEIQIQYTPVVITCKTPCTCKDKLLSQGTDKQPELYPKLLTTYMLILTLSAKNFGENKFRWICFTEIYSH